ncbi:methyltransferase domain-containing protein [Nitrospira sp. Kam-Ns4a]
MLDEEFLHILCCPVCRDTLTGGREVLACKGCGAKYAVKAGVPILVTRALLEREDVQVSKDKWGRHWKAWNWEAELEAYRRVNLPFIYNHLLPVESGQWFLEVGGGPSYLCYEVSRLGLNVVSVDLDLDILLKAKVSFERNGRKGYFVCASMNQLPFRPGIFDVSAGIGVLEHSRRIEESLVELSRVAKEGGRTFQTVPYLSLTTLVTASIRFGTVPHLPVLGAIVWAVHGKVLNGRYMRYGYEESYSPRFLRKAFAQAGFREVEVGFYDYDQAVCKRVPVIGRLTYRMMRLKCLEMRPFADIAYVQARR